MVLAPMATATAVAAPTAELGGAGQGTATMTSGAEVAVVMKEVAEVEDGNAMKSKAVVGSREATAVSVPRHYQGLNDEQLAAVRNHSSPHLVVSAGPGSGKTRTLIARVAEVIQVDTCIAPYCRTLLCYAKR